MKKYLNDLKRNEPLWIVRQSGENFTMSVSSAFSVSSRPVCVCMTLRYPTDGMVLGSEGQRLGLWLWNIFQALLVLPVRLSGRREFAVCWVTPVIVVLLLFQTTFCKPCRGPVSSCEIYDETFGDKRPAPQWRFTAVPATDSSRSWNEAVRDKRPATWWRYAALPAATDTSRSWNNAETFPRSSTSRISTISRISTRTWPQGTGEISERYSALSVEVNRLIHFTSAIHCVHK